MALRSVKRRPVRCPRVAVFVDATGAYGRGLLRGIADYVELHGPWSLFVDPRATGRLEPALLRRWKGDGVLAFIEDSRIAESLTRLGIPIVDAYGHPADLKLPWVGNDDQAIGQMAAEHLLDRKLLRFAYSGYPRQAWAERRREGFVRTVVQAGYQCASWQYPQRFSTLAAWEKAQRRLAEWLAGLPKPVGLMACSDRHAREILNACRRAGLAVPDDVAVIGSGNDEMICRLCDPPLSSVADNPRKIGFEAAGLLDQFMSRKRRIASEPLLIAPLGVVQRKSTGILVLEDKHVRAAMVYIRDHACENLSVSDVVRQVPLSRSTLYRRFHNDVGRSLHAEILRVRLERVKELLVQTSLSQERIARLAGFEHAEYMVAMFKRQVGVTPGRYRSECCPPQKTVHLPEN